jgi:hypothetical protein
MAKNSIRDYSATASSNTDVQSVNIDENCPASGINNAIREVMVDLKNVSTGAIALETPAADSLTVTGDLTVDTNTLKVDSTNNRVGVGTASPARQITVENTIANAGGEVGILSSDSSTSGTFGTVHFGNNTDTSLASIRAKADGSTTAGKLEFSTEADGGSIETRMTIDSSGKVGIGTSSPSAHLQVETSANSPVLFKSTNVNGGYVEYSLGGNGATLGYLGSANALVSTGATFGSPSNTDLCIRTQNNLVFSIGTTEHMRLTSAGFLHLLSMPNSAGNADLRFSTSNGAVSFDTSSRLVKENIVDCPYGLAEVIQLQPRKYLRTDDEAQEVGFIADEVSEILPEFVPMMPRSVFTKKDEDTDLVAGSVNYSKLTAVLTKAIQEQQSTIKALEAKHEALETKYEALEARITALEAG